MIVAAKSAEQSAELAKKFPLPLPKLLPILPVFAPSLLLRGGLGWGSTVISDSDDISDIKTIHVVADFAANADIKCTVKLQNLKNFVTEGNPLGRIKIVPNPLVVVWYWTKNYQLMTIDYEMALYCRRRHKNFDL